MFSHATSYLAIPPSFMYIYSTFLVRALEYMVTIVLYNKDTQPSQTCSEGYTFSATALYRGVSLFLGNINWTRLV